MVRRAAGLAAPLLFCFAVQAQIIDFESNGLHYKTLTKGGVTVMFAPLGSHVGAYAIMQVAISNGSAVSWSLRPEDFHYQKQDGEVEQAASADTVVNSLLEKASRHDVIKLVTTYEAGIYGNPHLKSTNGYEARREDALAMVSSARIKAAAAASAIAFVPTKLLPGQSTDGAIFFPNGGKPLGAGKLTIHTAGEDFEFPSDGEASGK